VGKINKLQPWLTKARAHQTQDKSLLHQLKKVKVLSVVENEPFIVNAGPESAK